MNRDTLKGEWRQLKGTLRKQWANITDDDVEKINGDYDRLIGKLEEKYGVGKDKARQMVDDFKSR